METILKISKANTGKHRTEESRKRMSEAQKRKAPVSTTTKDKISKALTGRPVSENTRNKIGDGNAKNTYSITSPDGTIEVIRNLTKYCKENNLDDRAMVAVSKHRHKHHKGYLCEIVGVKNDAALKDKRDELLGKR